MLTPLVVAVMVRGRLPLLPYLLALAMSANLGSVATLVGNPQNMIIGHLSRDSLSAILRVARARGAGGTGDSILRSAVCAFREGLLAAGRLDSPAEDAAARPLDCAALH